MRPMRCPAARCTAECRRRSQAHKRTSVDGRRPGTCWSSGAGPSGAAAGVLARASAATACSWSRRSASPARRPAATGSRRGPSASSHDMGLAEPLARVPALRRPALDRARHDPRAAPGPSTPTSPTYGYVVRRRDLDEMVAERAVKAGADAVAGRRGRRAARRGRPASRAPSITKRRRRRPSRCRARYVVVADGANSRFGRALGTARDRTYPLGMAIRGYFTSPFHDEPWIESHLDLRDRDGNHLPGLRLDLPGGRRHGERRRRPAVDVHRVEGHQHQHADGRVRRDRAGALGHLARDVVRRRPPAGKLPTGGSVDARTSGPRGSSSATPPGSVNPFNGEGISVAYETGRLAADAVIGRARDRRRPRARDATRSSSRRSTASTSRWRALFVRAIGNPAVMRELTRVGMQSRPLMEWVLRIMANLLRPDELGPAEAAYKMVAGHGRRRAGTREMAKASDDRFGGKVVAALVRRRRSSCCSCRTSVTSSTSSAPARTEPTARCRPSSNG